MNEQMNNDLNQHNAEENVNQDLQSSLESTMPHLPVFVENSMPSQESYSSGRIMKSDNYVAQETPIIAREDDAQPEFSVYNEEISSADHNSAIISENKQNEEKEKQEALSFTGILKKSVKTVKMPKAESEEKIVERVPRARRMRLSVTRVAPWSVAKVSFLMLIALAIVQIVMVAIVWIFLNSIGLFGKFTQIVASTGLSNNGFNLADFLSLPTVLSATTIVSIIEVVVFTLIAAIMAALYNVVSALVGGVRVTLGDD